MNVRPERLKWALFGGLVLLVFACFAPDLRNGLLDWDDGAYILDLVDWVPLGRLRRHGFLGIVREKLPRMLLVGLSAWITTWAMAAEIFSLERVGLPSRALVALQAITGYLRLTLLPGAISPVYLHPGNVRMGVAHVGDIALIACLTVGAFLAARRWPAILAAWLVFLGALVPFLGFLQNGPQAMAARFTYFPSTALCVLLGGGDGPALDPRGSARTQGAPRVDAPDAGRPRGDHGAGYRGLEWQRVALEPCHRTSAGAIRKALLPARDVSDPRGALPGGAARRKPGPRDRAAEGLRREPWRQPPAWLPSGGAASANRRRMCRRSRSLLHWVDFRRRHLEPS